MARMADEYPVPGHLLRPHARALRAAGRRDHLRQRRQRRPPQGRRLARLLRDRRPGAARHARLRRVRARALRLRAPAARAGRDAADHELRGSGAGERSEPHDERGRSTAAQTGSGRRGAATGRRRRPACAAATCRLLAGRRPPSAASRRPARAVQAVARAFAAPAAGGLRVAGGVALWAVVYHFWLPFIVWLFHDVLQPAATAAGPPRSSSSSTTASRCCCCSPSSSSASASCARSSARSARGPCCTAGARRPAT